MMEPILLALSAGCTLLLLLAIGAFALAEKPQPGSERLMELAANGRSEQRKQDHMQRFQDGLAGLLATVRGKLGLRVNSKLQDKLESARLRGPRALDAFSAVQWMLPLVGAFAGSFLPQNTMFWCFMLAVAGYLLPGLWLTSRIKQRKERIRRSMPDAMDLLVICVDAGLGLDQAMIRVCDELAISHRDVQEEFHRVQLEQRAGSARMEAWKRFAARVDLKEVSAFVSMLVQTEKFGTPIARALSRFAEDLRTQRRQHAEEAAAKTRVKIVFPLVFFIFPCLFIVLLAPAMMGILRILQDLK
jgi:tight adherence protein C